VTHTKASYYLRRIYKLLQDEDTILRLRKFRGNLEGVAISEAQYMAVDPRRSFGATVIHECLHILYPDKPMDYGRDKDCSRWVRKTEEGICNALTNRQWANLYYRLGNKLQ
jgi:hypothetical protein